MFQSKKPLYKKNNVIKVCNANNKIVFMHVKGSYAVTELISNEANDKNNAQKILNYH